MLEIVVMSACVVIAVCAYLNARISWVHEYRLAILRNKGLAEYEALPSFTYMLLCRPFCWDMQKFVRGQSNE